MSLLHRFSNFERKEPHVLEILERILGLPSVFATPGVYLYSRGSDRANDGVITLAIHPTGVRAVLAFLSGLIVLFLRKKQHIPPVEQAQSVYRSQW